MKRAARSPCLEPPTYPCLPPLSMPVRRRAGPALPANQPGRGARRGGNPGPPPHIHRRHAGCAVVLALCVLSAGTPHPYALQAWAEAAAGLLHSRFTSDLSPFASELLPPSLLLPVLLTQLLHRLRPCRSWPCRARDTGDAQGGCARPAATAGRGGPASRVAVVCGAHGSCARLCKFGSATGVLLCLYAAAMQRQLGSRLPCACGAA